MLKAVKCELSRQVKCYVRPVQRLRTSNIYEIINSIKKYPVSNMCNIAQVSKSGYYKWLKNKNKISFRNILDNTYIKEIFFRNKGKKGILRIKMEIEEKYGIKMNKKKIGRIMKEQGLITQTRRKNPYGQRTKSNEEKFYCENLIP